MCDISGWLCNDIEFTGTHQSRRLLWFPARHFYRDNTAGSPDGSDSASAKDETLEAAMKTRN
jgi:hypothetical protein